MFWRDFGNVPRRFSWRDFGNVPGGDFGNVPGRDVGNVPADDFVELKNGQGHPKERNLTKLHRISQGIERWTWFKRISGEQLSGTGKVNCGEKLRQRNRGAGSPTCFAGFNKSAVSKSLATKRMSRLLRRHSPINGRINAEKGKRKKYWSSLAAAAGKGHLRQVGGRCLSGDCRNGLQMVDILSIREAHVPAKGVLELLQRHLLPDEAVVRNSPALVTDA